MHRLRRFFPAVVLLAFAALAALPASAQAPRHGHHHAKGATCKGKDPCNACKNCKYCKLCNEGGGQCGVCRKKPAKTPAARSTRPASPTQAGTEPR